MNGEQITKLLDSPIVTVLSLVLAVVGIILAVLFYLKSRRFKRARFSVNSRTLIETTGAELSGLQIQYDGAAQERITVSKIGIWNCGTEPIRPPDIATSSPLRIEVEAGCDVLAASIVFTSDPANQFSLGDRQPSEPDQPSRIPFAFEYLDTREGAVVQIVHTGPSNHRIGVSGKLIGGRPPERTRSIHQRAAHMSRQMYRMYSEPRGLLYSGLAMGFVMLIAGIAAAFQHPGGIGLAIFGGLVLFAYGSMFAESGPKDIADHMK